MERLREEIAMRRKHMFHNSLHVEAYGMKNHSQKLTPAFVFSYFQLMKWLSDQTEAVAEESM